MRHLNQESEINRKQKQRVFYKDGWAEQELWSECNNYELPRHAMTTKTNQKCVLIIFSTQTVLTFSGQFGLSLASSDISVDMMIVVGYHFLSGTWKKKTLLNNDQKRSIEFQFL